MKKLITIWLVLMAFFGAQAQEDSSFLLVRSFEGDIAGAAMDNLQNLYIISSTGQIRKFNAAGDSVAVYNQMRNSGKLTSLDVSNPLKILLFYQDFSTVVVLDRFLATLTTVDLRRAGILQPLAIGLSYDNNLWVFDAYDNRLKKLDEQGNHLMETADFRNVFSQGIQPQKIINTNGLVYLADTTGIVMVLDNYGSFKKKMTLQPWQSFSVLNNYLVSTSNGTVSVYNTSTQMQSSKKFPGFQPYLHSFISGDKFISFSPSRLHIYRYRF